MKFKYIKKKLIELRSEVEVDNEIGQFDINKIVEDVYMHILNDVYGWDLKNANLLQENFPAIDLIDEENMVVIQVTSTTDKTKLKSTIEKFKKLDDEYSIYDLKMFYIKEKPKFSKAILEEFKNIELLGIKDILREVQANTDVCDKLYKRFEKIFIDGNYKSNKISEFDKKLYIKFLSDLPISGAIGFIHDFNFHYPFKLHKLDELDDFQNKWNSVEYEFINRNLELKKLQFYEKLVIFLDKLKYEVDATHIEGVVAIIPQENRGGIKPSNLLEIVDEVNNLQREVYTLHQEFVRLGKKYIYQ